MADVESLTEELKTELFAQHERQRELDFLKLQMRDAAKRITELSDELDALYASESHN